MEINLQGGVNPQRGALSRSFSSVCANLTTGCGKKSGRAQWFKWAGTGFT